MSTYSKTALRVLLTSLAALVTLVMIAGPASAGVGKCYYVEPTVKSGYANFNDNPAGGWPGDAIRACDTAADSWAVTAYLDLGRNGTWDRSTSTWGHNSPYCTAWLGGNIAEGAEADLRVCNTKGSERRNCRIIGVIA